MADFIFKPTSDAVGVFSSATEFENWQPDNSFSVAGGTYDIYQKVESGFEVQSVAAPFAVANRQQDPVITATQGALSVTIGAGDRAGTYATRATDNAPLTVEMVAAAPTCILLPTVSGTPSVGEPLTRQSGLWLFAGDDPGAPTFRWISGTTGDTGQGGLQYVATARDVGQSLYVTETFGGETVPSLPTSPVVSPPFVDPTSLGSDLFVWLDLADAGSLFADATRTTPVTTTGQNVRGFADKSGFGRHGACPEDGITWDATTEQINANGSQAILVPAEGAVQDMEVYIAVKTSWTWALLGSNFAANALGAAIFGQFNSPTTAVGMPIYGKNGVDLSVQSRDALASEWCIDTGLVAHARLVDLTQISENKSNEDDLCFLALSEDGLGGLSHNATQIIVTRNLTALQRSELLAWMNTRLPV